MSILRLPRQAHLKPKVQTGEATHSLTKARAAYLHEALPVAIWGSGGLALLYGVVYWAHGFRREVLVWAVLGLAAWALRLVLERWYGRHLAGEASQTQSAQFLWGCTLASLLAGGMFGWGWATIYPHLDADERTTFLMGNVALLFGGLYAYSPHLPTFFAFALVSLAPGVWLVLTSDRELGEWLGDTAGLGLITVVSLMFAFRAARAFRDNHLLQARELTLLQEITEKRDAAVAATLAKSRFLASVSHDLRQPMHAINLYLTALAGGYARQRQNPADAAAGETVRSSIQSLQESTNYLNSMFEALLDVSRLDAGTVAVNIQHTSLMRMVAQLEADYTQLAKAEGLRFEVRLPRQFPVMEVQTDAALLERLLRNLLVNAMRYTRTGGVRLSLVASDRQLDFRVVDTGPGVERAMRQRIFDEFYQVPGSQEKASRSANTGSGIGLGLSIASRLAEKLNARIRLHTRPGWGSVFAVRLPMRHALRPAADDWPSSILPGPTEALPGGSFVAVIDDDLEILRSTRMMLESFGLKVYTAVSGAEAVAHLGKMGERPDLLISDYRLGAEDGISVIDRLREEFNEQVPAILITGDTSAEHVAIFKQSGLTVLHKPISGHALMAAIQAEMKAQPQTPKSIPSP